MTNLRVGLALLEWQIERLSAWGLRLGRLDPRDADAFEGALGLLSAILGVYGREGGVSAAVRLEWVDGEAPDKAHSLYPESSLDELRTAWRLWLAASEERLGARLRGLALTRLRRLRFLAPLRLICGNGTWLLTAAPFAVVYDDDSRGDVHSGALQDLGLARRDGRNLSWSPAGWPEGALEALDELVEICDWWVEATGGEDLTVD
jgi:hypothetical protein